MKKSFAGKRLLAAVLAGTMLLGTVGEVYAADGGSSASEATVLSLDTTYDVVIEEAGDEAWFSYTPSETGTYTFVSFDNTLDTCCYLYLDDE